LRSGSARAASDPASEQATVEKICTIIQSSLQAISDEIFDSMRKTPMSSMIYEVLDILCSELDRVRRVGDEMTRTASSGGVA
jgi:hypothetical protein